jgi:hypothetical protein
MIVLNKKGVTLVELLIYLGLSSMMLVILGELFVSILNESMETQNYSAVQTDGRYVTARLRYVVNNADSIATPANLGDISNELVAIYGANQYHYYINGDKLYLNDGSGDYLVSNLDSKITDLVFSRQGNAGGKPVILVSFKASSGIEGTAQQESQTFVGAGGLR